MEIGLLGVRILCSKIRELCYALMLTIYANCAPQISHYAFNPLPTNDAIWRRQILAACYQLAQSVLKIGSALAERVGQGEVGGCTALADSAWRRLQLPVEKPWSMPGGPFVCFLHKRV